MNRARTATSVIWKTVVVAGAMIAVPACTQSKTGASTTPVTSTPAPPPAEPVEVTPPVVEERVAEPEPPPAPVMVTIMVKSKPAGAEVYVGDEEAPRGKTPFALEIEQGAELQVRVVKKGYQEAVETVSLGEDRELEVALVKVKARPRPPRGGGKGVGRGFVLS